MKPLTFLTAAVLVTAAAPASFAMDKMDLDAPLKMIFHGKPGWWMMMKDMPAPMMTMPMKPMKMGMPMPDMKAPMKMPMMMKPMAMK